jgi:hypothetical protein
MSNPAVITLDNVTKGKFKRFVVEDNIGESIHLHIDNFRIDFTIQEFLLFATMVRKSLRELDILHGYKLDSFDEFFLKQCTSYLPYLSKITIEDIALSKMKCIVYRRYFKYFKIAKKVSIKNTPAYKYLQEDMNDFITYKQYNYFDINNEQRLLKLCDSIKNNGYPQHNQYIILFSGEDTIRDGQHRAAILAHLYGLDAKIKVMRFKFSNKKHRVNIIKTNIYGNIRILFKLVYKLLKFYFKK